MLNWVATRVISALAQAPGTRCLSITVSTECSRIRRAVDSLLLPFLA